CPTYRPRTRWPPGRPGRGEPRSIGRRGDRPARRAGAVARAGPGRPGQPGLAGPRRRPGHRRGRGRPGRGGHRGRPGRRRRAGPGRRRCGDAARRAAEAKPDMSTGPDGSPEAGERLVSPVADADGGGSGSPLRPKRLNAFIGQARVREQLSLLLAGALRRGKAPDHVLLSGPPGLGKTTIAMIIAVELGTPLRITSGPAIERSGDLAAVLSTLGDGEGVFIDEIHRLARPAEEMLYLAMEDFRVDVVVGKGPGATAIPLEIAPFTLVGATTRAGLLPAPLRDRFGFTAHLDFYEAGEL